MKKLVILFLLVVAGQLAQAQVYQDAVYLKNGSIIKGTIIEQVPNESIKILSAGNTFVFRMDEIEKIAKEVVEVKRGRRGPREFEKSALKKGYQGIAEIGMGVTYGSDITGANETVKVNMINGYRFNPFLAVGVGAGARFLLHDDNSVLTPLFVDVRANMINAKTSPYISVSAGHLYRASSNFASFGTLFGFGVGVTIKLTDKNSLNLGLSYEAVGSSGNDYFMSEIFSGKYRSLGFNLGFNF